jgi:hypothetical protein
VSYPDNIYETLDDWAGDALQLHTELLPLMTPLARFDGFDADQRQTLGFLLSAAARSSQAALSLVADGQLWDAEVIVRSVFEASIKTAYLLQRQESFAERHDEYAHALFRIGLLKDHSKVADLLATVPDGENPSWKPLRDKLLSADEFERLSLEYPSKTRRALDTKWGFTGLLGELSRSADPLFRGFLGLAHGYSMASHILHADHIGTSVPLDIDRRPPERRDALIRGQGNRLISDVFSCLHLRLAVAYRFVGHDPHPVASAAQQINQLIASHGPVYEDWMDVEYR